MDESKEIKAKSQVSNDTVLGISKSLDKGRTIKEFSQLPWLLSSSASASLLASCLWRRFPMTEFNPIIPPPDLVHNWCQQLKTNGDRVDLLLVKAAQWGADIELEACVEWLEDVSCDDPQDTAKTLRAARRPKQPSLKEQALALVAELTDQETGCFKDDDLSIIRRALEQLND